MRRILVTALGAADVRGGDGGNSAMAQDTLEVKVPFPFLVNGRTLPAGNYTITAKHRPHPCI